MHKGLTNCEIKQNTIRRLNKVMMRIKQMKGNEKYVEVAMCV